MEKSTNFALVDSFVMEGPHGTVYQPVEYVWIGGTGQDIRSKTKMYQRKIESLKDLEEWNFDGSSTRQATTEASEVILKPVALFRDPFRKPNGLIALCETFMPDGRPAACNFRNTCAKVMQEAEAQKPWFGIEQEYVILVHKGTTFKYPLGWPEGGFPGQQGPYYCAVGAGNCFGRELVEYHMKCCVYAGLQFAGINGEVLPAQWEFQIGPAEGINIGDHLWMARYFLARAAEFFNWDVSFDPKPVPGDWNGAGAHCNYSTLEMRNKGGYSVVEDFMPKLAAKHKDHLRVYGEGNESRLTGKHETSSMETFSYGVGSRASSVRIPTSTQKNNCGYIEDRRPAASADPYLVSGMIVDTTLLNSKYSQEIIKAYETSGCKDVRQGWKSF